MCEAPSAPATLKITIRVMVMYCLKIDCREKVGDLVAEAGFEPATFGL